MGLAAGLFGFGGVGVEEVAVSLLLVVGGIPRTIEVLEARDFLTSAIST